MNEYDNKIWRPCLIISAIGLAVCLALWPKYGPVAPTLQKHYPQKIRLRYLRFDERRADIHRGRTTGEDEADETPNQTRN